MAATPEGHARIQKLLDHQKQVDAGLIPADSPPTFTLPQPLDDKGLPWWYGPDYHPDPSTMGEWSRPFNAPSEDSDEAPGDSTS